MGTDIISELPDCLVAKIHSYLPISDLVKTSVLSKSWEFLWLNVSVLDLTFVKLSFNGEALDKLIHRFVKLNSGSRLQKFKIKYGKPFYSARKREITFSNSLQEIKKIKYYYSSYGNNGVLELIAEVVHSGVQHLDVESIKPDIDSIPKYVYVSKTLVSLRLVNVWLENTKFVVCLPCLKIMHLEDILYKTEGFFIIKKLISASPPLEDLTFDFPSSLVPKRINLCHDLSVSRKRNHNKFSQPFYGLPKPKEIEFTKVPRCLKSALEYIKINKLMMNEGNGIELVNYFLENSAVLKKLTLIKDPSITMQEAERYKKLLTSKKLSPTCQVIID